MERKNYFFVSPQIIFAISDCPGQAGRMGIIKDIDKGNGEIIRIETSEFKGQQYLNLRIWYTDKESGNFKPTQKGIALRPDLYPQLKEAILAAETEIQQ